MSENPYREGFIVLLDFRIGIDLGGTKIASIAIDADGTVLRQGRAPTPRHDYTATLKTIADLVRAIEEDLGQKAAVGIGMPGAISLATGRVKNANSTWLNGKRFAQDLETLLGRRLRFENDANCFALSEALDGAASDARVVFGVIVGTGTGGGIVIDGRIWRGLNAIAGEWGHSPLPAPRAKEFAARQCYCGRKGCIETYLSGPGLSRDYEEMTGERLEPPAIAERARTGEAEAEEVLSRYEDRMARGLAGVINLLDPEIIVLGGGMSNIDRLYDNVPARWSRYIFSDLVTTRLVRALHGDASGVRGAARLWETG